MKSLTTSCTTTTLAPDSIWPEAARRFVELLPAAAILDLRYTEMLKEATHWHALESNGFLHLSPLYETEGIVQDFLPDEPLSDDEKKTEPKSTATHRRTEIAFLSGNERSIIDRARNSATKALSLVRFIMDYVLPADTRAFDKEIAKCNAGVEHRFFRANWLTPLRRRVWVPIGDKKSETPSAESLAILPTKESDLLKRIGQERVSQFLRAIGVSPADLMLRSVGRYDPERVSLIQSLADITAAAGNDPEKVKALAGAIQEDPEVLKIVEDRRARQQTVKRNQALGNLVEGLFVEAFKNTGLRPNRTGPGHDYSVEAAAGEEDDAGQIEVTGPAGSVFVEIKATTTNGARMSVKQVTEAVANKDRYYLCVLQVSEITPDVGLFKDKARFVVEIGDKLQNLYDQYLSMKTNLGLTQKTEGGLAIELTEQQARFRVAEQVWSDGTDFSAIIEILKSRLLVPAGIPRRPDYSLTV